MVRWWPLSNVSAALVRHTTSANAFGSLNAPNIWQQRPSVADPVASHSIYLNLCLSIAPSRRLHLSSLARDDGPGGGKFFTSSRPRRLGAKPTRLPHNALGKDSSKSIRDRPTDTEAIRELQHFLSPINQNSSSGTTMTPNRIRSLYISVDHRKQLHHLDQRCMSALISYLGTISLCQPRRRSAYTNMLALEARNSNHKVWWTMILRVAKDKQQLHGKLAPFDHYWIGMALLNSEAEDVESGQGPSLISVEKAFDHYQQIIAATSDPEIHLPFLRAMTVAYRDKALESFCKILDAHEYFHRRIQAAFWEVVLKPSSSVSAELQERILDALWQRFRKRLSEGDEMVHEPPTSAVALPESRRAVPLTASKVTASLSWSLLGPTSRPLPLRSYGYLVEREVNAAFGPHNPLQARWHNLLHLALYQASSEVRAAHDGLSLYPTIGTPDTQNNWQALFVLSTLEKMVDCKRILPLGDPLNNAVKGVTDMLFRSWSEHIPLGHTRSFILRAVLMSFLRLATATGDVQLKRRCWQYASDTELFLAQGSLARSQQEILAAEYAITAAVGGQRWDDTMHFLGRVFLMPGWRENVTQFSVQRLVTLDPLRADALVAYCEFSGLSVPQGSLSEVGHALVLTGHLEHALPYLRKLQKPASEHLLHEFLRVFFDSQTVSLPAHIAAVIGESLSSVYQEEPPPPEHARKIQYIISTLVLSQEAKQATAIFKRILRHSPIYFHGGAYADLTKALLRGEQVRLAVSIVELAEANFATSCALLWDYVYHALFRTRRHKFAWRLYLRKGHQSLKSPWLQLASATQFTGKLRGRNSAVLILRTLRRDSYRSSTLLAGIRILVSSRNIGIAKRIYKQRRAFMDPSVRRLVTNIILSASLSRHRRGGGAQRATKVFEEFRQLAQDLGAEPNRVTLNILLKGLLHWRAIMTSDRLKALFDHMIRLGYPGTGQDRRTPPFGSLTTEGMNLDDAVSVGLARSLETHISFEHHVKPMCQAFEQAFRKIGDAESARVVVGVMKDAQQDAKRIQEAQART